MRAYMGMAALALIGCTPATSAKPAARDADPPPTETTDTDTDTGTKTDTDTTPTTAVFDCSTVPDQPLSTTPLEAPRGYNDLVFDVDGAMIGSDGDALIKATSPDVAALYASGVGTVYKMGYLPGGDVVAATASGQILRVAPDGGKSVLAAGVTAYGLAVGSDGMVYIGTNYTGGGDGIARIDPATGEITILLDGAAYPPRAIGFSRDFSTLYFGTLNGGEVYRVPLDANLDPSGDPELLVTLPGGWHDTLEVDACGNVYVGSFFSWSIYRIHADLSITRLLQWDFDHYGHGFEWGSAAGGWNEQAIYVTHPYVGERVDEVVIGVPGASWPGEVIGGTTL